MQKLTKLALIGSLFTVLTAPALAARGDSAAGTTSNASASTSCPGAGTCYFDNLRDWDEGRNPEIAAYYYCTPPEGPGTFRMENHGVLITGFDKDGILEGSFESLRAHSFGAYRDPKPSFIHWVGIKNKATGENIICQAGRGNPVRPVMPNQGSGPAVAAPRF